MRPFPPILAACLLLTLTGCGASNNEARRQLPAASAIFERATPLPAVRAGTPATVAAAENRAAAAANIRKLESAERNYEALRAEYAGGEE